MITFSIDSRVCPSILPGCTGKPFSSSWSGGRGIPRGGGGGREEELAGVVDVVEGDGRGGVVETAACERELLGVVGGFLGITVLTLPGVQGNRFEVLEVAVEVPHEVEEERRKKLLGEYDE